MEIIADGKIIFKNLTEAGLNTQWLNQQLNQAGINSIKEVFYAELQAGNSLYIKKKMK